MIDVYLILVYTVSYIGLITTFFYLFSLYDARKRNIDDLESTEKKVTIIIPAFNEEQAVERTLKSALNIDYPKNKLEIIFVNDGSTDKTYELAKKFKSKGVIILSKKNGGKGSAINYGLKQAKGEIIFTMDADSFVNPDAVKKMAALFENPEVMSVTPSMLVNKPKNILEKIQWLEYFLGVFLRRTFAILNAIHITPGAFSAYRKSFFDKTGGFDEHNITEDMEIALRIQANDYIIENSPKAVVFTNCPKTFKACVYQRRRWYVGLMRNVWNYRKKLFGPRKGALGTIVLPLAIISVLFSIVLTSYVFVKTFNKIKRELLLLESINFKFMNLPELNKFVIENFLYNILSEKILLLTFLFLILLGIYMYYASKKTKQREKLIISFAFFLMFYTILFVFWWIISIFYVISNKKVKWRADGIKK